MNTKHIKLYPCPRLNAHLSTGACRALQHRALRTYFTHFYESIDLFDLDINDVAVMSACGQCENSVYKIPLDEVLAACAADLRQLIDADYWELDDPEPGAQLYSSSTLTRFVAEDTKHGEMD